MTTEEKQTQESFVKQSNELRELKARIRAYLDAQDSENVPRWRVLEMRDELRKLLT